MKFLALEKEIAQAQSADYQPYLRAEAARLYELYQTGIVRECYFHQTEHTAVLVLESASLEQAQEALDSLPLVEAGLIRFEVIPLTPYTGFARLFQG